MASPEEFVGTLERVGEEFAHLIEGQSDEAFHRRPAEEEWTAAEVTGHVAEFPVTFAAQALRLSGSQLARGGRPKATPANNRRGCPRPAGKGSHLVAAR